MATVVTIPQTTVPAGPLTLGPANVNSTVKQYVLTVNQIAWPNAGDLAFTYQCDVSLDSGATWINPPPSAGNVYDVAVPAKFGNPANQFKIVCDIPGVGNANRKIRFTANFAKSLTVSGTLAAN
jgi:hypothetical protein